MTDFGDNTLRNPFEIQEAREAEYTATKAQRDHGDVLAKAHLKLAQAEYLYRRKLTKRIKELHVGGMAITMCEGVAKGEQEVGRLRRRRDELKGELAKAEDYSYTLAADRRALKGIVEWSMYRDLRVEAEPLRYDPASGEISPPLRSAA